MNCFKILAPAVAVLLLLGFCWSTVAAADGAEEYYGKPKTTGCATVKCSAGYHCEVRQVFCIRAPCPPRAGCVPDVLPEPVSPCATVRCRSGTHCEVQQIFCIRAPCPRPRARCVPDEEPVASGCAVTLCLTGTRCVERQVQCVRAPCPPIAECVTDDGSSK